STNDESPINVTNNDDGTFAVEGVDEPDFFADARRALNRVSDSAVSALYELGVAQGTGMGYFSPARSVSRAEMAAFITRALGHTSARPGGVTIQSDGPGEVIISVRDANFQPVANAPVDVFSAAANKVDEAFKEDGSCNTARVTPVGNTDVCEIGALDAITGLDGDYDPGAITVNTDAGGTTVWAWTGESGDKVEDGGAGIASVNLTATAPVEAEVAKVTTDIPVGVSRQAFGSTVTVTIQLVGNAASNRADAVADSGGNSYTVSIHRASETDIETDGTPAAVTSGTTVSTPTLKVDASGKATFTITADDPDPTDSNNPDGTSGEADTFKIDRVRVTYTVTLATGGRAVAETADVTGSSSTGTITFSDARGVLAGASIKPAADFLTRPMSGSASNVVTVTVVDQYGKPIRGHLVRLSSTHDPVGSPDANASAFPVARRTDSSGSVRIGYAYTGGPSVETITANTASDTTATATLAPITAGGNNVTKAFYWVAPAGTTGASGQVLASDIERNTIIVASTDGPQLVTYDDNDQYAVGASGSEDFTSMATFEEALGADESNNDTVVVSSYDPTDSSDVARFVLTVVDN
ncbi:MAG: S-layer homology domain-containing protein, partial [Acidimicrobiaceae bacterium]|nr:S-layer homology domain-containing protein [Acidimicrobiaceae bacterium]